MLLKKSFYGVLATFCVVLIGYTLYYGKTHTPSTITPLPLATSTETAASSSPTTVKTFTSGNKTITITETNPVGKSLSTLTITTTGFASNTPITLERDALLDVFFQDVTEDKKEELLIVTMSAGSGSYGTIDIFTTAKEEALTPIPLPEINEENSKEGGLFYGYMGHDSFIIDNTTLTRSFPIYTATDTSNDPHGGVTKLFYTFKEHNNVFEVTISTTSPQQTAQTTAHLSSTSTTIVATSSLTSLPKFFSSYSTKNQSSLDGTSWVWKNTTITKSTTSTPPQGAPFVLSFKKGGKISSTTDCNTLYASYSLEKSLFVLGEMVSTLMFCENSKEEDYKTQLQEMYYLVAKDSTTLLLADKTGSKIMTFSLQK